MRDAAPRPVSLPPRARAAVKRRLSGKAQLPDEVPAWLNALFADMAPGVLMPEDPAEKDAAFVQSWWTAFARRLPDRVRKHLAERFAATLGEDATVLSFEILAAAVLMKAALAYYPTNENHPDDEPSPVTLGRLADLVRYCGQDLTPYSNDAFLRAALQEAITS